MVYAMVLDPSCLDHICKVSNMIEEGTNLMRVSALHIYPVKAGRVIDLRASRVQPMGLAHDRQWMIVDETGLALTQRCTPALAQLETAISAAEELSICAPGYFNVHVPVPIENNCNINVTVWSSTFEAIPADPAISDLLSTWLGKKVQLVRFPNRDVRLSNPIWAGDNAAVGFADGYPILIALTASLDDLNRHLSAPVTMSRFRANIVIEGAKPWEDDNWRRIKIGAVELELVKPCVRCVVTTLDPATGERLGPEPLTTLAKIRRSKVPDINGVLFGTNAVPRTLGEIAIGDVVEVLDIHTPWAVAG